MKDNNKKIQSALDELRGRDVSFNMNDYMTLSLHNQAKIIALLETLVDKSQLEDIEARTIQRLQDYLDILDEMNR